LENLEILCHASSVYERLVEVRFTVY